MTYQLRTSDESVLICPGAAVTGDVVLGKGVSVWYNAVIRGDDGTITVGEDTNIQDCAVLHETTTVGRGCTIGHGAIVHGCTVGDNTLIGMGATVLNGAGHRQDGRPRRVHDPGQPRQGGAAPDRSGDREQPGGLPGLSGGGRPLPGGERPLRATCRKRRGKGLRFRRIRLLRPKSRAGILAS